MCGVRDGEAKSERLKWPSKELIMRWTRVVAISRQLQSSGKRKKRKYQERFFTREINTFCSGTPSIDCIHSFCLLIKKNVANIGFQNRKHFEYLL